MPGLPSMDDLEAALGRAPRRHPARLVRRSAERTPRARRVVAYAFDPSERAEVGLRKHEWTAVHPTEEGVVREMARC
jgi:hypothetical protein